uniref:Uncharacterized protein n=1 Tax=Parascaris equorum TaxID=6256 RepID=A0A914SJR1_PAREQ
MQVKNFAMIKTHALFGVSNAVLCGTRPLVNRLRMHIASSTHMFYLSSADVDNVIRHSGIYLLGFFC